MDKPRDSCYTEPMQRGLTQLALLLTLAGTFLGMYFVLLIITIVYSMFAQLIGFFVMLYSELRLR